MSKRKAGVNDIIYELDNEDIESISDDEVKEPKINRLETVNTTTSTGNDTTPKESEKGKSHLDNLCIEVADSPSPTIIQNGGKTSADLDVDNLQNGSESQPNEDEVDSVKKTTDCCKTTILNEDIVIDSPGNSDLGVEGCENRTPLVTVRFRDKAMARSYKEQVKAFMLNLIKLHEGEGPCSDNETDLELDIWPEDLADEPMEENVDNNLFFVDTDPGYDKADDIPRYSQTATVISNDVEKDPAPAPARRGPSCFNCDGSHQLRDCPEPKDFARIAIKRRSMPARVGRYHVEDEQKFGHLIPGRISGQLRHALGLKRHEMPMHIYRMRLLGYPPGWLEEARISHSGLAMFDSGGNAILDPEDEEGELCEPGSKDKFDIKKILDFPGFNVPPSSRYKEEAHAFGLPPMSDQDSKMSMLQFLAPNAMKAYKRKKLTMFPSTASTNTTLEGQAEMELDSGDEAPAFPSVPPLPDEAPPALPPPPPPPPNPPPPPEEQKQEKQDLDKSSDDLEVIEVLKVADIPVPMSDFIVIDEDNDDADKKSVPSSPTLDDLEAKKRLLLDALDVTGDTTATHDITISDTTEVGDDTLNITSDSVVEVPLCDEEKDNTDKQEIVDTVTKEEAVDEVVPTDANIDETTDKSEVPVETKESAASTTAEEVEKQDNTQETTVIDTQPSTEDQSQTVSVESTEAASPQNDDTQNSDVPKTPDSKTGQVKDTEYGTPVMNIASSYMKLPSDDKFAKDICDIINFENLPNSTGKYKQISALLRKVKQEVDRIQDS